MRGVEKAAENRKVRLPFIFLLAAVLIFTYLNLGRDEGAGIKGDNNPFFLESNYRFSIMMARELRQEEALYVKVDKLLPSDVLRIHRCTNKHCSRATTAIQWSGTEVNSGDTVSYSTPKDAEHYIWIEDKNAESKNQRSIRVEQVKVEGNNIAVTYSSGSKVVLSLDNLNVHQDQTLIGSIENQLSGIFHQIVSKITGKIESEPKPLIAIDTVNNLVRNGGFDANLSYWHSRYDLKPFSQSPQDGYSKKGSLSVRTTPPESPKKGRIYQANISQCIPLIGGARYRFGASFKPQGSYLSEHTNRVNLYWYQSKDCSVRGQFGTYLEPKSGNVNWQRVVRTVTRALDAKAVRIEISQNAKSANDTPALWDDIEFVATEWEAERETPDISQYTLPLGRNYIKNGEFSEKLKHWRYSGDTTWRDDVGVKKDGAARLAIFSDRGGYGAHGFSQCINLGVPRVFYFGAKVKVDSRSTYEGGGIFRLSWNEELNCGGRSAAGFKEDRVEYVDGWQTIGVDEIVAPDSALSATLYFTRGIRDSGTFAYFVDDVYFKAKE